MRRSRKPLWAFLVHRGFESLPLRWIAESGDLTVPRDTARAMSQENVEIARRGYPPLVKGLSQCDFDAAFFERLDPEIGRARERERG